MPNLVWEPLNEKMLRNLIIPDSVRAAYNADPSHTRKFMMLKYKEEETKGKRAQTEVLSLDLAATLQAYLDVRQWLLEQINAKKLKLEPDRGTLFFNRHGRALKEHNLRSHVMRLTRNYAGKAIPPHLCGISTHSISGTACNWCRKRPRKAAQKVLAYRSAYH